MLVFLRKLPIVIFVFSIHTVWQETFHQPIGSTPTMPSALIFSAQWLLLRTTRFNIKRCFHFAKRVHC